MKILICASEVAPIIKMGGLGDVIGSLPKALAGVGVEADIVVPFYPTAKLSGYKVYKSVDILVPFKNSSFTVSVYVTKLPGSDVDVFMLKNDDVFGNSGTSATTGIKSETEMFSFFSRSVVELIKTRFNTYDLVHCNDWHTGLIPQLIKEELGLERPATVMTIHNFSYQGIGDPDVATVVGLEPTAHRFVSWDVDDGDINLLMQGIASCDFVTTVSPSYAKELLASNESGKIFDVLKARKDRFIGILNGIDYDAFPRSYGIDNAGECKKTAKESLIKKLNLVSDDAPIFSMISRLDPNQKGLDILLDSLPYIMSRHGRFVLLGSGDKKWEEKFTEAMDKYGRESISINTTFDPNLAIEIYEASDFFIIPSKFEPCGLTQMISMWYGTIPVAHSVGGLKDSISHGKNGFLFEDYSSDSLSKALSKCFDIYKSQLHFDMIKASINMDFGFAKSALAYKGLYEKAIQINSEAYVSNDGTN